jgi:hypothetical protein
VLESEKRQKEKRVGCVQLTADQSRCTGLSGGAPDSVRCARLALVKRLLSGFVGGVRLKITGLSGAAPDCPVPQRSAAQSARDAWPGQRSDGGTGLSGAPPAPNLKRSAALE